MWTMSMTSETSKFTEWMKSTGSIHTIYYTKNVFYIRVSPIFIQFLANPISILKENALTKCYLEGYKCNSWVWKSTRTFICINRGGFWRLGMLRWTPTFGVPNTLSSPIAIVSTLFFLLFRFCSISGWFARPLLRFRGKLMT